jgi:tRNA threonylcarbamoyladenosine biosynthesis protein TsaB
MAIHILHIETSSKNCSVSVGSNGKLNSLCEETSPDFKHSENLHTFIEWALEGAELELKDIHAVSVGKGPGSYTGLRIGAASAKGLCFGNDIPLLSVNSLYILASPYFNSGYDFIIPVMDARRAEVYTSVFDLQGNCIEETHAHVLHEDSFKKYRTQRILFVGDATEKTEKFFQTTHKNIQNCSFINSFPSAENMITSSYKKYQSKDFENTAYFDPLYLKEWK